MTFGFGNATYGPDPYSPADYVKAREAGVSQNQPFVLDPSKSCPANWEQRTTGDEGWKQTWCHPTGRSSKTGLYIVLGLGIGLGAILLIRSLK